MYLGKCQEHSSLQTLEQSQEKEKIQFLNYQWMLLHASNYNCAPLFLISCV